MNAHSNITMNKLHSEKDILPYNITMNVHSNIIANKYPSAEKDRM